jgi:HNH endonuclease
MSTRILALDIKGTPFKWFTPQQAVNRIVNDKIAWSLGDESIMHLRGGVQKNGVQSEIFVPPIIALAKSEGMVKHMGEIKLGRDNAPLFRRDNYRCGYCGTKTHSLTRDHIIPTSRNGLDVWSNVISACHFCNSQKSNKLLSETKMSLIMLPYTPNRFEHFILSGRNILADQMEYLSKGVNKNSRFKLLN